MTTEKDKEMASIILDTLTKREQMENDITPEKVEHLERVRKANVGRPKNGEGKRERDHRATFVVSKELVFQLKYISLMDGRLLKDVISEAITEYVTKWERKKGTDIPEAMTSK